MLYLHWFVTFQSCLMRYLIARAEGELGHGEGEAAELEGDGAHPHGEDDHGEPLQEDAHQRRLMVRVPHRDHLNNNHSLKLAADSL